MKQGRQTEDFGGVVIDARYRLKGRLPDGSHAAIHLPTGRRVSLRRASGDSARVMQLKRTLNRVVALDHPALVPVLDTGTDEHGLYLVESVVEGEALDALLGEAQPPERVVDIVRQLARILADAHGQGIFHGSLSPSCVVLQQTTGRADYVRLSGLGLTGTLFGRSAGPWMAPEVQGGEIAGPRSDLFALGLIGRALAGGVSPGEAMTGALPGTPPVLLEVLDALVRRSPGQRPQSAAAVLGPLERAATLRAQGGRALSDTIMGRTAVPERAPRTTPRATPSQPIMLPRPRRWPWIAAMVFLVAVIAFLLIERPGEQAPTPAMAPTPTPAAAPVVPTPAPAPPAAEIPVPSTPEPLDVPPDAAPLGDPPPSAPPAAAEPRAGAPSPRAVHKAKPATPTVEDDLMLDPVPLEAGEQLVAPVPVERPARPRKPARKPPPPPPPVEPTSAPKVYDKL